jgi:glycosyltransferase involved in cell wall biosynthesis
LEIIVSDGMSDDATRQVVEALQNRHSNLRLIDNAGKIVPTGLNAAIAQARGEIIVRIDGHCEIARDYVSRCVEHILAADVECVGGPLETIGETPTSRIIALTMSSSFGVGNSAFRTTKEKTMLTDTVAFPAYKRGVIDDIGLFDEELVRNQDDEYNYRLREFGGRILLVSDVRSVYYSRGSLASLWRQYFQYGYWKVRVMQKHPKQMRLRHFVPSLLVAALIFSILLATLTMAGVWLLMSVAAAYVSSNLLASLITLRKSRSGQGAVSILMPVCFAILHFSYGSGFLFGLIKFRNRWGDKGSRPSALHVQAQQP